MVRGLEPGGVGLNILPINPVVLRVLLPLFSQVSISQLVAESGNVINTLRLTLGILFTLGSCRNHYVSKVKIIVVKRLYKPKDVIYRIAVKEHRRYAFAFINRLVATA